MTGNTKQATPLRMVHQANRWTLELEELVPVTRSIFRPVVYNVEGQESILDWLKSSGYPSLAGQAAQIFEQPIESDAAKILEPHNQSWVQVHRPSVSNQKGETDSIQIERLEHRLRSVERRLLRLQDLESQVAQLVNLSKRVMSNPSAQPKPEAPAAPLVQADEPLPEAQAAPAAPLVQADEPSPEAQAAPETESETAEEPALDPEAQIEPMETEEQTESSAPAISLRFPAIETIEKVLVSLIGSSLDLAVLPKDEKTPVQELNSGYYYCELTDDKANIVGLMLADTIATVKLGGSLMMIPEDVLAEEIEQGRPSDEEVDAMTEIFNNICPLINKEAQNPHVASSEAQSFSSTKYEWIENCSTWLEARSETTGRLIMLSG